MTPYRARPCPQCQYYLGYTIAKPLQGNPEASVTSFCLNCNYRLPVRAVVRGMKDRPAKRAPRQANRPSQRAHDFHGSAASWGASALQNGEAATQPANYSRDLRVVGQQLEKRCFTTFNLKCSGDGYFVWSTETIPQPLSDDLAQTFSWGGAPVHGDSLADPATKMLLDRIVGFQCASGDVAELEREGVKKRRSGNAVTDGRRLSHLLRTIGEQLYRRNRRLLAIAWQERRIGVVAETAAGRREMNVLRSDNLYDLWVRMYLQRSH